MSEVFGYERDGSSEADFYLDPDPVCIPSLGVWRVYTNNEVELVYFEKAEEEFCVSAEDAWTLAPPMEVAPPSPPTQEPERKRPRPETGGPALRHPSKRHRGTPTSD